MKRGDYRRYVQELSAMTRHTVQVECFKVVSQKAHTKVQRKKWTERNTSQKGANWVQSNYESMLNPPAESPWLKPSCNEQRVPFSVSHQWPHSSSGAQTHPHFSQFLVQTDNGRVQVARVVELAHAEWVLHLEWLTTENVLFLSDAN